MPTKKNILNLKALLAQHLSVESQNSQLSNVSTFSYFFISAQLIGKMITWVQNLKKQKTNWNFCIEIWTKLLNPSIIYGISYFIRGEQYQRPYTPFFSITDSKARGGALTLYFFGHEHATLHIAVSVGMSVGPSVRHIFWIPSNFRITAPKQPYTTGLPCIRPCFFEKKLNNKLT